jgi:hypothetical protein
VAFGAVACVSARISPLPEALLDELTARAEFARNLRFEAPVSAWGVPEEGVAALLRRELEVGWSEADLRRSEALGVELGLLPPGTDLQRALLSFQSEAVAGFYTPLADALYVVAPAGRLASLTGADRAIVVHELVHALQAQHTRLLDVTLGLDDHDDLGFALGALLEGDALWASFRDRERFESIAKTPAADFSAEFALEWSAPPADGTPRLIRDAFLIQYPTGYTLTEALIEQGGLAALDAAEADPPLSSEMLLHPERYLDRAQRRPLSLPILDPVRVAPGCEPVARNRFGELGLRIWALEGGRPSAQAEAAADGWDGDGALLVECSAGSAFAWVIDFDTEVDAAEFEREARLAVGDRARVAVERAGARVLVSRDLPPGGSAAALRSPVERFGNLAEYLEARPDVLERARERRDRAKR